MYKEVSMQESADAIRLDSHGILGSRVLNAYVTNVNSVACNLYKYGAYYYLSFYNVYTMQALTGQYNITIIYTDKLVAS